jgi:stringent starvation protein B
MVELSTKPYLIRAIYEWCADCGYTPYLSVRVDENTRVPMEYVKEGEIVLNVGQGASRNLTISNDIIQFSARFNGVSREIAVPTYAVQGIFARETGKGAFFEVEETPENFSVSDDKPRRAESDPKADGKPGLRLASVSTLYNTGADDENATPADSVPHIAAEKAADNNSIRTMRSVPNAPLRAESEKTATEKPTLSKPKAPTKVSPNKTADSQGVPTVKAITPSLPVNNVVTSLPAAASSDTEAPPEDPPPTAPNGSENGGKKSGLRIIK